MSRKAWDLAFTAEAEQVASLRRIMRLHLGLWGLHDLADEAQLCVSELVSNIITHVGPGTPAKLVVSMNGTHLRIEVHDPDARALPTLLDAEYDSESGRGMALVDAIAHRWGVHLFADRKVTWCELATGLAVPMDQADGSSGVTRVKVLLGPYAPGGCQGEGSASRLSRTVTQETVIAVIADFLYWLRAYGCDEEEVLDRAQTRFEALVSGAGVGG